MSLVGSLEDLGLADILQIVNLARKSGMLLVRCEGGEGRIAFREGLVHAAVVKGEPEALDELLRRAGIGGPPPGPERIEALRRDLVEHCLARMFEWRSGEFSFEMQDDPDCGEGLALEVGISPQYLTMEATRRNDERRAGVGESGEGALCFSGESEADPVETLALATVDRADPPELDRVACACAVIVDPDLPALEWLKTTLSDRFERLHLFQSAEGGITRIRQYLSRGEVPAVFLSVHAPLDPLSGIESVGELLRRLRVQAPRMPLLLVAEEGSPTPRAARLADGLLVRPTPAALLDPRAPDRVAAAARAVRAQVARFTR